MRGIEAALEIITGLNKNNNEKFGSELLRKLAERTKMKATDISLASSLIYITMRRKELWEAIANNYLKEDLKSLPPVVRDCIITGTGGLLELRRFSGGVLVSAIVDYIRKAKELKFVSLTNAVLHKINEQGREKLDELKNSNRPEEKALFAGVPVWSLPAWLRTWDIAELNKLFTLMLQPPVSSIRIKREYFDDVISKIDPDLRPVKSNISSAVHLNSTVAPSELPGFNNGECTLQSESSIITASIVHEFYNGGLILDMCSGRGIKAGQILEESPDASIECWEISEGRHKSAIKEIERLKFSNRAVFKCGSAFDLQPDKQPNFIILDVPCSCSGTWNRKPESKWQMNWERFDKIVFTQKKLLERALKMCSAGGYVLYITCSLLKQENENLIAEALMKNKDCVEISELIKFKGDPFHKGRPWGVYVWPSTAWLDGFYCSLIMKKEV